jgi:hypothetical protein
MPERLRAPEYDDDFKVRRTDGSGFFCWKGAYLRAGNPLANQPLGLRQTDDDEWELHYGPLLLAYVLMRDGKPLIEPLS